MVAVLGVSPSLAADERAAAHDVARFVGVPLVEVETYEGDRPEYRANGADRCFHCKDELFARIGDDVADAHRLDAVAYGENADDTRRPDRPGARAATNHRVLRPLSDAGLDKAAVRRLARAWALPSADKPAAPCLASRIPHHSEVTPEKLAQIDTAEAALRALGFADLRVRHHGDIARIELPADDLVRAAAEPLRRQVRQAVVGAGFRYAVLDLGGLQSGDFTLTVLRRFRRPWLTRSASTRSLDLDWDRTRRRGYPEAVYCAEKTAEQVGLIAAAARERPGVTTLFTRANAQHAEAVLHEVPDARYDDAARLLAWPPDPPPPTGGLVAVLAAGTSDLPVAREA